MREQVAKMNVTTRKMKIYFQDLKPAKIVDIMYVTYCGISRLNKEDYHSLIFGHVVLSKFK